MSRPTQNEEPKRVVVFGRISTAICLSHSEERRNDNSKTKIEEPESTEDGVGVGVAEDEFPLRGDDHADAGDGEEVAYEGCGYREAAETH